MRRIFILHRNTVLIVFVLSLLAYNLTTVSAQDSPTTDPTGVQQGPDPRVELRAEASLPGVDIDSRRAIVNDKTLLGEKPLLNEPPSVKIPQTHAAQLRLELEEAKADLAKTKELIGEILKENKQLAETRELPPLKEAELKVFYLRHIQPETASRMIASILGSEQLRLGYDAESRALVAAAPPTR